MLVAFCFLYIVNGRLNFDGAYSEGGVFLRGA